jgi:uncharacterized phage-associated protein
MSVNSIKYENAILYLCKKSGGKIEGMTKLYKLLYYADFDRFEYKESMQTITGDEYRHLPNGPVPRQCSSVVDEMVRAGKLRKDLRETTYENDMTVFVALIEPDMNVFDEDEFYILDRVIEFYGKLSGKQLSALTHAEAPYIGVLPDECIPFEYAFYRGTKFVERATA